ncbi:MAG: glycosyltransferase [Thermodesulfovibrionales bacterium]
MNDLVSIIVTSYNHAEYLKKRIDSLLDQTYKNLEIIVVDDCSTDGSIVILEDYKKYNHIRVIALEKNTGHANASNLGADMASGNYIMFAECDDFDSPLHVETLVRSLKDHGDAGVAYCRSAMVDDKGEVFGDDLQVREPAFQTLCSSDTMIPGPRMQRFLLKSCVIPNMSAALIRKNIFDAVGGLSLSYTACADWDLWCRIAENSDFYFVTESLNSFRSHPTTVRNTAPIKVQLSDIFDLLYAASSRTTLTLAERLKFRINIAVLWANYLLPETRSWMKSFPGIWIKTLKYDKLSIIFLVLVLFKLTMNFIIRKFRQFTNIQK